MVEVGATTAAARQRRWAYLTPEGLEDGVAGRAVDEEVEHQKNLEERRFARRVDRTVVNGREEQIDGGVLGRREVSGGGENATSTYPEGREDQVGVLVRREHTRHRHEERQLEAGE